MPPKKKIPTKTSAQGQQPQEKLPVAQQKPAPVVTSQKQQTTQKRSQIPKQQPKLQTKKQSVKDENGKQTTKPLTEAEILKLRRQKFRNTSSLNANEDEKVREQRMKKFGLQPKETKQQIEQRKKKFANPGSSILTEDQQTLRQRRMKFALNSAQIVNESPQVLQERKKKFARSEQNLVSLDDEIAKTKKIKKQKDGSSRKDRKGRRQVKFRRGDRKNSRDLGKRSRKQIFGKKKFIKRAKLSGKRPHIKSQN